MNWLWKAKTSKTKSQSLPSLVVSTYCLWILYWNQPIRPFSGKNKEKHLYLIQRQTNTDSWRPTDIWKEHLDDLLWNGNETFLKKRTCWLRGCTALAGLLEPGLLLLHMQISVGYCARFPSSFLLSGYLLSELQWEAWSERLHVCVYVEWGMVWERGTGQRPICDHWLTVRAPVLGYTAAVTLAL